MKRFLIAFLALVFAAPLWGQNPRFTNVTGTISDANGTVYAGGRGIVTFVPGTGGQQSLFGNGQPFQQVLSFTLTSAGAFSISLADNTRIVPSGSQWLFSFCAADTVTCFASTQTISGTSQSVTSALAGSVALLYGFNGGAIKVGAGGITFSDLTVQTSAAPSTPTTVNGVTYPANPSTHSVPVITAANTATYKVISDCTDTGGNHLNFTQSTNAWSCGTSSSGGGLPSTSPLSAIMPIYNGILGDAVTPTSFVNADLQFHTGLSIGNEFETTTSSLFLGTTSTGEVELQVGNPGGGARGVAQFQSSAGALGIWVDTTHPSEIGATTSAGFNIDGPVTIGTGFAFGGSAKLELGNGTKVSPAYSWTSETGLGFYRPAVSDLVVVAGGQAIADIARGITSGALPIGWSNSNTDPDSGFGAIFSHDAGGGGDPPGRVTLGTTTGGTDGSLKTMNYLTDTNCSSSGGTCGSAAAGSVSIAAAATTVTVASTSVTANSQIFVQEDSSLGTKLSVTCNTTVVRTYAVTARTAATSFVITASAAPSTNPACLSYFIVN